MCVCTPVLTNAFVGSGPGGLLEQVVPEQGSPVASTAGIARQEGFMAQVLQTWLAGCRELLVRSIAGVVSPVPAWTTVGEQSTCVAGIIQSPPVLPIEEPGGTQVTGGGEAGSVVPGPVMVLSDGALKTVLQSKKNGMGPQTQCVYPTQGNLRLLQGPFRGAS